ncbi:MAG TPA: hypothetical protein VNH11_07695 [Pirellulales bacterium]|nr:hypothetical protein [Pirellulales bacterium]
MPTLVHAVGRSDLPAYPMSDRFRHEIAYFMSVPGAAGVPELAAGEYWVALDQTRTWLDEGAILVVSPLDSASRTEVELSEELEGWLEWMAKHQVEHIRIG